MSEALFYHLERKRYEDVLPGLLEKTIERGWRALVRADSADRASAIDALLWTYNDESFLPHAIEGECESSMQPVLVTLEPGNGNEAKVLFVVGGAHIEDWGAAKTTFDRVVVLFDGRDPSALSSAREAWKVAQKTGFETTYWQQNGAGKWERRQ